MSIQYVNIGTNPNDGTGDDLRSAFLKVNSNFTLLGQSILDSTTPKGANIGGGSGQVFAGVTNDTLNFRTLANGDGITLAVDGNIIRISSSIIASPSITKIFDNNNAYYEAQTTGASFKILGSGLISTQIIGNELTVSGNFALVNDVLPQLGADLNLNTRNITGTGNIQHVGSIITDNLTVGRSSGPGNFPSTTLLNGSLTVNAAATLQSASATSLLASTSVTSPIFNATGNGFFGTLTGNSTGTHYGNVSIRGLGVPDTIVVNTATSPATITGTHVGAFSGGITGTLISGGLDLNSQSIFGSGSISISSISNIVNTSPLIAEAKFYPSGINPRQIPTIDDLGSGTILSMEQQNFGMSEALRIRSKSINSSQFLPLGSSIAFESINEIDVNLPSYNPNSPPTQPLYQLHGYLGILNYREKEGLVNDEFVVQGQGLYSTFVAKVRTFQVNENTPYLLDVIVARGSGRITLGTGIDIQDSKISPYRIANSEGTEEIPSTNDLILFTERPDTYINFYGDFAPETGSGPAVGGYTFPKQIGAPGQVLAVRTPDGVTPNNLLQWITPAAGEGGSGGSTTLLGLTDTPVTYGFSDGGKILVVKSDLSGIEFASSITASVIGNVTGNVTGNASTATALQNTRTINGKDFNGTQNVTLTTADVSEVTNLYFTDDRARGAVTVTADKALSYDSVTGVFDIEESVSSTASSLVKRDIDGGTELIKLKVTTLEKNTADTAITVASKLQTSSMIESTSDIVTTATVSAGFITLTGTGDQTLSSSARLILDPVTSIDVSGKPITNLPLTAPTDNSDATPKKYVDDQITGVFNASFQTISLTGDGGGTLTVSKTNTVSISGSANIVTATTVNGVQVSLKSSISGVSITGNLPVSGTLTATVARAGNININNNEIQQTVTGNNLNIVPGSSGGSVIVTGGDFKLTSNSRLFITGSDVVEIPANSLEVEIPTLTPHTFVRTLNWVDDSAGLAFAFMNDGTQGQIKTIIMLDRGNYGNALDTRPRFLVLRGKFNGASRTINIAASDPNGSSTFVFLNGFWWRTANVA